VLSKRGFEASTSKYKADKGDELRKQPATINWDPAGRGPKLGDTEETFGAIQLIDKDGRLLAIGSDYFDKGPLRTNEASKTDKHAETRILRALEAAVPGEVPDGCLIGLVDQNVCPTCSAKLEEFARRKKLAAAVVHVPERPKLQSRPGMASPKTTSRTALGDLHDSANNPVKTTYRESFKLELRQPRGTPRPGPTLRSRMGAAGGTLAEAVVGLVLELIAVKIREKIDQKVYEERMRELLPSIEQRKVQAYNGAFAGGAPKPPGALYYNVEIRVTTTSRVIVAGAGSTTLSSFPQPEIQSVRITSQQINSAGPLQESSRVEHGAAVISVKQVQVITYSEPVPGSADQ
jgi:hypothetical protein